MLPSVVVVDAKPDQQPHEKAQPVFDRQAGHQDEAGHNRRNGNERRPRDSKAAGAFRLALAQDQNRDGNENEGEECADIGKIGEGADVEYARGDRDKNPATQVATSGVRKL